MDIRTISETYAVCGQISSEDLPEIVRSGFKALVCNRPEGESRNQESFDTIAQSARELGIEAAFLPIVPQGATDDDRAAFERLFTRLPKPVLAYCRSGNRSATLWHGLGPAARLSS
jgi:sulfide:quinone oxidoreductase